MKKNKIWLTLFILSLSLLLAVSGCGKTSSDDIGKTRVANNLEIKLEDIKLKISNNDKKQMLQLDFDVKNVGKETAGAGAGDFVIQTKDGKKHRMYGLNANNFGDEIPAGKILKGPGFYEIPIDQKEVTVIYEPYSQETTENVKWTVTIPAK
ncbi:DUF4352 domain-containing protein [Listeria booriae]|uniref:DUF4352 domain-containing protein n=1 Tax=Listeria booriae TaxID=1552123 RepID=A0A842DHN6_9LIST|nr:DUF4352 domain-containing protein [Listeria booriae]MBC1797758.1 DUF4352 domain-containing protein [Listeria booriae]MBC1811573.1 DUF4352 domain-containing protein [Listeria booriae]MBC2036259.1 DUF4352 domain-containing protein [Listeria booriae]MBC2149897.1 DUF4352 domain-containing protein [Listeria booriae]MBC2169492.1 DUF4352 domain-containing protein [Listeria booriae]